MQERSLLRPPSRRTTIVRAPNRSTTYQLLVPSFPGAVTQPPLPLPIVRGSGRRYRRRVLAIAPTSTPLPAIASTIASNGNPLSPARTRTAPRPEHCARSGGQPGLRTAYDREFDLDSCGPSATGAISAAMRLHRGRPELPRRAGRRYTLEGITTGGPVRVRKAVVLAAGYGTRMLPATKAQPKESLPIVDKPIIQYTVEEAAASGITQVIIVTAASKRAVEDHFDRSLELEMMLRDKGDHTRLAEMQKISDLADIMYIRQTEQKGVGHAVLQAKNAVGDEPFALLFPDDVLVADVPVTKQMIDVFDERGGSVIAVQRVPDSEVEQYGIVGGSDAGGGVVRVESLVEKPKLEDAPSRLGIVGRYVLTPEIFAMIEQTPPGKGREIQLTDALAALMAIQPVFAYEFEGRRYDTGRPLGLLVAAIEIGLRRADIGPGLRDFLRTLPLED
jgi:UTP--glucose-1-phosphate uridylyltransferase